MKIENYFFQSCWVIFFILLCLFVYEQGIKQRNAELEILKNQLIALEGERLILLEEHEDLTLQVNSQNDPAWIELTLKRVLGLVPDGSKKVFFLPPKNISQ